MPDLPVIQPIHGSRTTLLVRTGFADHPGWAGLRNSIETPSPEGFLAGVEIIERSEYSGVSPDQLVHLLPQNYRGPSFVFVADDLAVRPPDHPILVVPVPRPLRAARLDETPRSRFRVVAALLWSVENNLAQANMDWQEFAGTTVDGVFRGL